LKRKNRLGFVTPLYAPIPKLGDGSLMSKKDFAKKYDLYCEGLNPQNALMFCVGKKCMKVSALQQKVSLYEVISLYFE
jgi:hypothetical protein